MAEEKPAVPRNGEVGKPGSSSFESLTSAQDPKLITQSGGFFGAL